MSFAKPLEVFDLFVKEVAPSEKRIERDQKREQARTGFGASPKPLEESEEEASTHSSDCEEDSD